MHKPDKLEKGIRFGCGALFGVLIGVKSFVYHFFMGDADPDIYVVVTVALVCGLLAMKMGDRFWMWLKGWW